MATTVCNSIDQGQYFELDLKYIGLDGCEILTRRTVGGLKLVDIRFWDIDRLKPGYCAVNGVPYMRIWGEPHRLRFGNGVSLSTVIWTCREITDRQEQMDAMVAILENRMRFKTH